MPTHVLHFGPIPAANGDAHALFAADPTGLLIANTVAESLETAAAELARSLGREHEVTCDASLVDVGRWQGWKVGPVPEVAQEARLGIAFLVAHGGLLERMSPDVVLELCHAFSEFLRASPWEVLDSAVPQILTIAGEQGPRELSVLGAAGEEYGLALYDQPGTVQRLKARNFKMRDFSGVSIVLGLDDETPWLAEAFEALTGIHVSPRLMPVQRGKFVAPEARELKTLAAALYAVVALVNGDKTEASGVSQSMNAPLEVTVGLLPLAPPRKKSGSKAKRVAERSGFEFEVTLEGATPRVWRTLHIPAGFTLAALHDTLQLAFGWEDSHLHEFTVGKQVYGIPDEEGWDDREVIDDRTVALGELNLRKGSKLRYLYDFGDNWEVALKVTRALDDVASAQCVAGERAGPPDDCGGVWGFEELINAFENPSAPESRERLEWVGPRWKPDVFDVTRVNRGLKRVRA